MDLEAVRSSTIAAAGYHEETRRLRIQFVGGGTYEYHGVSPKTFKAFQEAESKGVFFANLIKGNPKYTVFKALDSVAGPVGTPTKAKDVAVVATPAYLVLMQASKLVPNMKPKVAVWMASGKPDKSKPSKAAKLFDLAWGLMTECGGDFKLAIETAQERRW